MMFYGDASEDLISLRFINLRARFSNGGKINCLFFCLNTSFVMKIFVFRKNNELLRFANLISANLSLSFSIDKSHPLSSELHFALHNSFIFLKWSLFLVL